MHKLICSKLRIFNRVSLALIPCFECSIFKLSREKVSLGHVNVFMSDKS